MSALRRPLFLSSLSALIALCPCSAGAMANPASKACEAAGGEVHITTRPNGGQAGICLFPNGKMCEEGAMMRGECPKGGIMVKGLSDAAAFCRVTGGTIVQEEYCRHPAGRMCTLKAYFAGTCPKGRHR